MEPTTLFTTTGIIVPTRWDPRGKVVAVAIATHAEEDYLVANLEEVPELIRHLKKEIELTGRRTVLQGVDAVFIDRYRLFEPEPAHTLSPGTNEAGPNAAPQKKKNE